MEEHRDLWWPSPTVDLGKVVHLDEGTLPPMVHGGTLGAVQVSYESWGELNANRDNAVLVVHPLAMDTHATGAYQDEPLGWWEPMIGPGRAIDTDRWFVVCPNLLGGCYGTTGPRFPSPDDGEPFLDRFPLLTPLDMMRAQRAFLGRIGIDRAHMVIGPSMGAMIAWEWAVEAGDAVERVVAVAAPLQTTAYQIGLNWLQRRGIELDLRDDEAAAKWGQMIARGVGMLSYRSAIGVEEKFGRNWFKRPGSTLKDRGVYNVESWMRHLGKKAVRRFDPYTYLLFSRAMDLHDVGSERGGVVAALDRVRCRVLAVGISSDELYPAAEVRAGADILDRLGRTVAYGEIRSPHGHDAFLLEPDQLSAILRGTPLPAPSVLPAAAPSDIREVRLGIIGAGRVSAMLLRLLEERSLQLIDRFGLRVEVTAVAEIDREKKLDTIFDGVEVIHDPDILAARDDVDVFLDLTRGNGSLPIVEQVLRRGRPIVTPNKRLVRDHGASLERLALEHDTRLAYHSSIAAGWPLLYSIDRPLGRQQVRGIQAVLSSTCNVILESLERGSTSSAALAVATAMEITEPDPELDISGWDTAQKLAILVARAYGRRFAMDGIAIVGINGLDPKLVRDAVAEGFRIKLIGLFVDGHPAPVIGVLPVAVPADGHLGNVKGDNNAVVLDSKDAGESVFFGKGAGELPVATAVLGDLVGLYHPQQSWTGRYPQAARTPREPVFSKYLTHDGTRAVVTDDADRTGTVPLLDSLLHPRRRD